MDSEKDKSLATDRVAKKSLGEMLVEENLITPAQLDSALALQQQQGGKLSDILLKQGLIQAEQLAIVLSIQLNLPLIDLKRHAIQPQALRLIPEDMARKHALIPLDIVNDSLMVVMADPEDIRTIEDVKAQAKIRVEVALGVRSDIERAIDLNYRSSGAIEKQVSQFTPTAAEKTDDTETLTARTPIAETLDLLITQAVKDRASDVHIEPQEDRLRIRYRIDGILHDMFSFPLSVHNLLVSRVKILSEMDISEQRRPQDGQFSIKLGVNEIDIRAATMETPSGERVTLRILDKSLALFTLAELGFQPEVVKKYRAMLKSPIGMILVSGPTGSGKTTTLYASINELDRNERNIMTIEDPIEYSFMDINQTQVNIKAGITFASGLRAIMRHDPDVILVGEIRDTDTVTTAIQSALTGHLVLSSIHANDAVGVLYRLMDLDVEPASISSTLIGIIAQRMVRRICPNCRAPYQPPKEEQRAFNKELDETITTFHHGTGCNLCANTGYRSRTGIFEFLVVSEEIRKMLRSHANAGEIRAQAIAEGMVPMKQDGMLKVKEGITSISEVMRSVFSIN
ncbi:MAG: Flp pilus assembly complex ATPase component TadA [Dehalococcoidales bacterium]|nr:Flp pilus assembly complex ATPase component TadA [Dehalococcoidales bacterium]